MSDLTDNKDVKKVYLCGPMSGIEDHNFPLFRRAAKILREVGFDVISPVEMDEKEGFDPTGEDVEPGTSQWAGFLARDVEVVASPSVHAIVALEGWEQSRGAALEVHVARELGKPVYSYETGERIKTPSKYQPPTEENVLEEANRLVSGDRMPQYGHPLDDFSKTAKMWEAILGIEIPPERVPLCMMAVKISRELHAPKRDNVVDIGGYARTLEMVYEKQEADRAVHQS